MTKATETAARVAALREWMREQGLGAFIFPSTDPHMGEYVPDYWKAREWISGFNGSAGTAVVTLSRAALWTDSRYWLAAEEQTEGTPFEVIRCRRNVATADELVAWINGDGTEGDIPAVGIDGWCAPQSYVTGLYGAASAAGLVLRTDLDPTSLWNDRPPLPASPIVIHPLEYAGETAVSKLRRLREAIVAKGANATIITQLDDIAWTLNLRGTDVHCTPVFVAYLAVLPDEVTLYVDPAKLTPEVERYLEEIQVRTAPYAALADDLRQSHALRGLRFLLDPDTTNSAIANAAPVAEPVIEAECPVAQMKTLKNDTEIRGLQSAMLKDGVAMVRFLHWMEDDKHSPEPLTELSIDQKLTALRAEQPGFRDISFDTIAGYGTHAAIVHYEATPETDIPLEPHGLLLLDSGAQYVDGTTDITRTIPLGPLTDEERRDYTLVLKGHLRLAMAVFPAGTSGTQLDVLARYAMWQDHKNYGHGTGHGVGSYLSVHEGPHQFRMNWMPAPLLPGMTITIEPGIYIAGSHGVRIENTMLIVEDDACGAVGCERFEASKASPARDGSNPSPITSSWCRLEPLTLCPIATTPIVMEMMTADELLYINKYHARVREAIMPLLSDPAERSWLTEATQPIG